MRLKDFFYKIYRKMSSVLINTFYEVKVEGRENIPEDKGFILVANHASFLDPLAIGVAITPKQLRWMILKSYYDLWFLRWFYWGAQCFPAERGRKGLRAIRRALDLVREGKIIGIFPEGRRSEDGKLGEGKRGVALVALKIGAPILPVAIIGSYEAYSRHRIFPKVGITITVRIGKLIQPDEFPEEEGKKALQEFTNMIMDSIRKLQKA